MRTEIWCSMSRSKLLEENLELFQCPNDSSPLEYDPHDSLSCPKCRSVFPIHAPNFVELVPRTQFSPAKAATNEHEKSFFDGYRRLFGERFSFRPEAMAWGSEERIGARNSGRKRKEVEQIVSAVNAAGRIVCDISGGAGWFTSTLAPEAKLIVHCDLSCDNLNYAHNKFKNGNILFVRMDFFSPPFRDNSFDITVCTDTLIYGDLMVSALLSSIYRSLRAGGSGVVDFYNRKHRNPFHRPYMIGYTRGEVESILRQLGIPIRSFDGFFQDWEGSLRWIIPPTRHIVTISK